VNMRWNINHRRTVLRRPSTQDQSDFKGIAD